MKDTQPTLADVRPTLAVTRILLIFLSDTKAAHHGYEIMQKTNYSSGKAYPILARLAAAGWLEKSESGDASGGPPRTSCYRLTPDGVCAARRLVADVRASVKV